MLWVFVVCTIECSQLVPSLPFKCQSDPPQSPHHAVVHHHHCCCRCQKIIKSIFTGTTCSCQGSEMSKYVLGFKADHCKRCWGEVLAPRSHLVWGALWPSSPKQLLIVKDLKKYACQSLCLGCIASSWVPVLGRGACSQVSPAAATEIAQPRSQQLWNLEAKNFELVALGNQFSLYA